MKNKSVLGKIAVSFAVFCLIAMVVVPVVTSAQGTPPTGACSDLSNKGLNGIVGCLIGVLNNVVVLLIAGGVVFTLYGAFEMISSEEKRESGKQRIYHGIIGLFVMVSVWGLVKIISSTFGLTNTPLPAPTFTVPGAGTGPGTGPTN